MATGGAKVWRCPGCGTAQVDDSRCFVCGRSATSCATCLSFRPAVVSGLGYCALDRRHEPLTGAEQRECWTAPDHAAPDGLFAGAGGAGRPAPPRRLIELLPRPVSGR